MKKIVVGVSLILVAVVMFSSCAGGTAVPSGERVFNLNAIEIKGATDSLAPPDINPERLGKTYGFKGPGDYDSSNPKKWQVASYQFNPSAMTVFQGDRVKLILFVVNGNVHKDSIIDPDGNIVVAETEHNRGRLYEITFNADKTGMYTLRCAEHKENMRAVITVVPN